MSFIDNYTDVLNPFVEKYKIAKNDKARKVLVQSAADAIHAYNDLSEDGGSHLPKDLQAVCCFPYHHFLSTHF